jgi:hypothetical protein
MSYVGDPFENDVFVSYSHGDLRESGATQLSRWSAMFAKSLKEELEISCREKVELYYDEGGDADHAVNPMAPLTDQLRAALSNTAVLTILMSGQYIDSRYCRMEREHWFENQRLHEIEVVDRAAVVRAFPTGKGSWPRELIDRYEDELFGFYFYDRTTDLDSVRPFGWPADATPEFSRKVLDVVGKVKRKLDIVRGELAQRRRAEEEAGRLAASGGQTIYVHGRTTRAKEWDQAVTKLSKNGYSVLPLEPEDVATDPARIRQSREYRVQALSACDALLLVSANDNRELAADMGVVGKEDRQLARELSGRLLPCAVLDTTDAASEALRQRIAQTFGISWIPAAGEGWVQDLRRWLREASQQVAR